MFGISVMIGGILGLIFCFAIYLIYEGIKEIIIERRCERKIREIERKYKNV